MKFLFAVLALVNWTVSLFLYHNHGGQAYMVSVDVWSAACLVMAYMEFRK